MNQERKTINNNLELDYYVGSTFSIHSHEKDPENCEGYPQILNGERWEVSTQGYEKASFIIWIPSSWDSYTTNLNTAVMFFHTHLSVVGMS